MSDSPHMPPRRTRFKICCIQDADEVRMAVRYGASAVGLVSTMPSGPGVISDAEIAKIAKSVPPGVASFLLTSATAPDVIIAQQRASGVDTLQLCDRMATSAYAQLRLGLPGIRLVQVIHVTGPESLEEAKSIAHHVDALLLDSGRPDAAIKELGGTGRVHNWQVSRSIVETVDKPVFLAGGLRPENAREAIEAVRPYALDVCSGLRENERLVESRLAAFVESIETATNTR